MSALLGLAGLTGYGIGCALGFKVVANITTPPFASLLEKCSVNPTAKKTAAIVLYALLAIAAIAVHLAIPPIGVGLVTGILKGALIGPLLCVSTVVVHHLLPRGTEDEKKRASTYIQTTLAINFIGIPALLFGMPLVATVGAVGFARNLYLVTIAP